MSSITKFENLGHQYHFGGLQWWFQTFVWNFQVSFLWGKIYLLWKQRRKIPWWNRKHQNSEFSGFKIAWFWKQRRKKLTQRGWWYSGYGLVYHFPLLHAQVIQTVFFSFCCSVEDLVAAREKRQVKVADCVFDSGLSAMFLGRGAVEWNRTCWFYLDNALWNPSVCCRLLNVLSYINIYMSIFTVYCNFFFEMSW